MIYVAVAISEPSHMLSEIRTIRHATNHVLDSAHPSHGHVGLALILEMTRLADGLHDV